MKETSIVVLLVANLLDAIFTLAFLQLGVAAEANPLMRWAYEGSPLSFVAAKIALVELGVGLLWLHRRAAAARFALHASAALYVGVVGYHVTLLGLVDGAAAS